jgi:hypothetical protein
MTRLVPFLIAFIVIVLPSCAAPQQVDYGVISATPYSSETSLGLARMDKFLRKMNPQKQALLAQTPYIAVQAGSMPASEVGTIMRRINSGNSRGITTGYGQRPADAMSREVAFILVFDSRTRTLAADDGVLALDSPGRGKIGMYGGFSAIYIERGY